MIRTLEHKGRGVLAILAKWEEEHPYIFSLLLSILIMLYLLFSTPSLDVSDEDMTSVENIQFIDIDTIESPKRLVKKEISIDPSNAAVDTSQIDRAVGTSDDESAVDIAFFPNIAPPKPVGRLKKRYPEIAREMSIEAVVNVELLIASTGKVKNVGILGIRLNKELPPDLYSKIARDFRRDAIIILLGAQFTPPIVQGKRVPIRMEMPLRFRLEQ